MESLVESEVEYEREGEDTTSSEVKERKILDDRLKQRWASKARRRSSEFKRFVDDKLCLQDNPKILMTIGKNG